MEKKFTIYGYKKVYKDSRYGSIPAGSRIEVDVGSGNIIEVTKILLKNGGAGASTVNIKVSKDNTESLVIQIPLQANELKELELDTVFYEVDTVIFENDANSQDSVQMLIAFNVYT